MWDAISSEKTLLSGRYKEGKAEGKAEMILAMHDSGMTISQITNFAKLSEEEVKAILRIVA